MSVGEIRFNLIVIYGLMASISLGLVVFSESFCY